MKGIFGISYIGALAVVDAFNYKMSYCDKEKI